MNHLIRSGVALMTLGASVAHAGAANPIQKELTEVRGMVEVAEGLYAEFGQGSASFVAINSQGTLALSDRVRKLHLELSQRFARDGIEPQEARLLDRIERSAEELRVEAAVKAYQSGTGTCGNGSTLRAWASATSGHSASAYAVNASDFGPATPTDNQVWVADDFLSQHVSSVGLTPAEAAVAKPGSCNSVAEAKVYCPGQSAAAVRAYAWSLSRAPACLY